MLLPAEFFVAFFTPALVEASEQEQVPHVQLHVPHPATFDPAMRFACCSAEISCIVFNLNSFIVVKVLN